MGAAINARFDEVNVVGGTRIKAPSDEVLRAIFKKYGQVIGLGT